MCASKAAAKGLVFFVALFIAGCGFVSQQSVSHVQLDDVLIVSPPEREGLLFVIRLRERVKGYEPTHEGDKGYAYILFSNLSYSQTTRFSSEDGSYGISRAVAGITLVDAKSKETVLMQNFISITDFEQSTIQSLNRKQNENIRLQLIANLADQTAISLQSWAAKADLEERVP